MSLEPASSPEQQRFDDAVRRHHQESLVQLSPRVRAQLIQRRNAAGRGPAVHRGLGLPASAAAFAALCALAIGLQLRPAAVPGAGSMVETAVATVPADGRAGSTLLDEDPEFYAWLASPDAQQVAME